MAKPAEMKPSGPPGIAKKMAKYGVRSAREAVDKTGVTARSLSSGAAVRYLSAREIRENAEKASMHEREVREKSMAARDAGVWADAGEPAFVPAPPRPKALTLTPPPEPAGATESAAKASMWPPAPPPVPEPSGPPSSLVLIDSGAVSNLTGSAAASRSDQQAAKARPAVPEPLGPPPKPKQAGTPAAEESDEENWGNWVAPPPEPKARPDSEKQNSAAMKLAIDRVTAAKQQMKAVTEARLRQLAEMRRAAEAQRKANAERAAAARAPEADFPWREPEAREWEPGPRRDFRSGRERRHKRPISAASDVAGSDPAEVASTAEVAAAAEAEVAVSATADVPAPVPKPTRRVRPSTSSDRHASEDAEITAEETCEKCGSTLTGQCKIAMPSVGGLCPHPCCPHCHPDQCSFHHEFDRITAHLRRDPPAGGPSGSSSSSLLK